VPSAKAAVVAALKGVVAAVVATEASSTTGTANAIVKPELILPAFCELLRSFWSEEQKEVSNDFFWPST
jgi:hypothetical protein